ncbi:MAG: metallophosphoesterase [Hyphomonadaceae bacterium]
MSEPNLIRAIGDVHGEVAMLQVAAAGAERLILLGDLVDRGPDSPGVLRLALDLLESGRARLVRSNHDDKLHRVLMGRPVKVGVHLGKTLADLDAAPDSGELKRRFIRQFERAPYHIWHGAYVFAHGAVHPQVHSPARTLEDHVSVTARTRHVESMALYGEVDGTIDARGKPVRHYNWVDQIPPEVVAVVGHDRRNGTTPKAYSGRAGGKAYFLDTGCGKGGPLSYIDLPSEQLGQVQPITV